MIEKVKNMTYAELRDSYDFVMALINMPDIHPVPEGLVSIADIGAGRALRIYETDMAEIIGEHEAMKAKRRRVRRDDARNKRRSENYVKRNGNNFRRGEHQRGDKRYCYEEDLRMPEARAKSKERTDRADWELDLRDLMWDIDYAEFGVENGEKDISCFRAEIFRLDDEYNQMHEAMMQIEERIAELVGAIDVQEKYVNQDKDFLRKYNYVKEMM